jgi:hypothetical protein
VVWVTSTCGSASDCIAIDWYAPSFSGVAGTTYYVIADASEPHDRGQSSLMVADY